MKRILIFNDSLVAGGTEVILVNLLNYLSTKGHAVTLLLPCQSDDNVLLRQLSPSLTIRYLQNKRRSALWSKIDEMQMIFYPSCYRKKKNIQISDYDLAICFKDSFYSRIFAGINIPTILWVHNVMYTRSYTINSIKERLSIWLNKRQLRKVEYGYRQFDKVICVSEICKEAYMRIVFQQKQVRQHIEILHNAIDLSRIKKLAKETIDDIPQGRTNFVLVTRLSVEKRIDRLLNAIKRLSTEKHDFHVYLIGAQTNGDTVRNDVSELGITDQITLLGQLENPHPYVLQSNWALCVSERESFSLTLLESMALNTPVITTNCGGPTEIIAGGTYGILVDNSTEGVYMGMRKVLEDTTLSVKYSSNLDKALQRFDYERWLKSIAEILELDQNI